MVFSLVLPIAVNPKSRLVADTLRPLPPKLPISFLVPSSSLNHTCGFPESIAGEFSPM